MCAYFYFFLSVVFSLITICVSYVASSTSNISRCNGVDVRSRHIRWWTCLRNTIFPVIGVLIPALQIGLPITYIYIFIQWQKGITNEYK
jgi:hypothetical protein